jgi:hypothetical protein
VAGDRLLVRFEAVSPIKVVVKCTEDEFLLKGRVFWARSAALADRFRPIFILASFSDFFVIVFCLILFLGIVFCLLLFLLI